MSAFQTTDFDFTDEAGDSLLITPSNAGVMVRAKLRLDEGFRSVLVPPHLWADLCRAGYRALGQVVPDLPDIPDPAEVEALARVLYIERRNEPVEAVTPNERDRDVARAILAAGYRKDGE